VAGRNRGRDLRDVADLRREVAGERVDVVRQVLPDAGDALDVRLAAEPALGADLARDARDLRRERAELVDHRENGSLAWRHIAADLDGDLAREVAVRDRSRDGGDVPHLRRQRRGEAVDRVGQVLPDAGDALDLRLAAEPALVADLARDTRDLVRERGELVDHR